MTGNNDGPAGESRSLDEAAERLLQARREHRTTTPVRHLIGPLDGDAAYGVQRRVTAALEDGTRHVVGHKIGLTSPAVQAQLGVDQPDFGVLFDDMIRVSPANIPIEELLQPRVEAELAIVLSADLDDDTLDYHDVRAAAGTVVAALEIVDSRITGWDISFADTVADNASAGMVVLGSDHHTLDDIEPAAVTMAMAIDAVTVSTGRGTDCLGDPLSALLWLARRAQANGDPLRAGQLVLTGALGPVRPVTAGSTVVAHISGFEPVTAHFGNLPADVRSASSALHDAPQHHTPTSKGHP